MKSNTVAKILAWALMGSIIFASQVAADVSYNKETRSLIISGDTSKYQQIMATRAFANQEIDTVYMWGNGGEFYAGMAIGRGIKESGARVIIPTGKECISACAFAAMGASELITDGSLLLHRPFTISVPAMETMEGIAGHYGFAYMEMAEYLVDMGYSIGLAKYVIKYSSPCKFLVIENQDDLSAVRDGVNELVVSDRCYQDAR